jgi:hypothetical protein
VERAGSLYFELADAIKQASENILTDATPTPTTTTPADTATDGGGGSATTCTLVELLEQLGGAGGGLKQYLLPLKKAGVTIEALLALATPDATTNLNPNPSPSPGVEGEEAAEAAEAAVRQALRAGGVKKIGHREQIVQAVLAMAVAAAGAGAGGAGGGCKGAAQG